MRWARRRRATNSSVDLVSGSSDPGWLTGEA
jgi:hypothetical protein